MRVKSHENRSLGSQAQAIAFRRNAGKVPDNLGELSWRLQNVAQMKTSAWGATDTRLTNRPACCIGAASDGLQIDGLLTKQTFQSLTRKTVTLQS